MTYRFKVVDETGEAMRLFPSKQEAQRFLQDGWQIVALPKRDMYTEALQKVGECLI